MTVVRLWCERALLPSGVESRVLLGIEDGMIVSVEVDVGPNTDMDPGMDTDMDTNAGASTDRTQSVTRLAGLTMPGFANAHSHAFHRALRGRTHAGPGDFWTWRDQMYAVAARLTPVNYLALARATFAEMVCAGYTVVGEFHYVHHLPGGEPYDDPNEMGRMLIRAASEAGIRLTLLDACYLRGGAGVALNDAQQRFGDGTVDRWAARVGELHDDFADHDAVRIGAAIHSVRAVDAPSIATVATFATERRMPLHAHVSEQIGENEQSASEHRRTPTEILAQQGALTSGFTAVHATHLTSNDIDLYAAARCTCCFCPTTERDLADGIGPSIDLAAAGVALAIGSDQHAVIDPFEEIRAIETDERLRSMRRGNHTPMALANAGSAAGYASLGWASGGAIAVGGLADLTTVSLDSPRLAGAPVDALIDAVVFAATASDVSDVFIGGRHVVTNGRHRTIDVAAELAHSIVAVSGNAGEQEA